MNIPQSQGPKHTWAFWARLLFGIMAIICLITGGVAWLLSAGRIISTNWTVALLIAFAVLGVIFALCQWLFPFSPLASKPPTPIQSQPIQIFVPVQPTPKTISTSPVTFGEVSLPSSIWNVPFRQNPFFIGRENVLKQLRDQLTTTRPTVLTQPQAISGFGGIGKTQIAVEYAYLYRKEYRFIFWMNTSTRETIIADFVTTANLLKLPERGEQDQSKLIAAIKQWFEMHDGWLLVFDNADEVEVLYDFLPTGDKGHILVTTRAHTLGNLAHIIEVEKMDAQEGILLLLRRAKMLKADETLEQVIPKDRLNAETIVNELDGLPLAIDQASAYIEEAPCSLTDYFTFYQIHRKELLQKRGNPDHPESVATTLLLSLERVEHTSPSAADLLRVCAFLAPDAIPEEIITGGATHLGPLLASVASDSFQFTEAVKHVNKFSLIRRNVDTKDLSIHRLVQSVIKDEMTQEVQKMWADRVVHAVDVVFPVVDVTTWNECRRYIPHALACAELIEQYNLTFTEAARLMNRVAMYLYEHGLYDQAEPLFQRALSIYQQVLGLHHTDTVNSLNNLASLYYKQGDYIQAEPLFQQALSIHKQILGLQHPKTASNLNNLATLYDNQGKYHQAKLLFQQALSIYEQGLGLQHPKTALSLNNLALLYYKQGEYDHAEPLFQRALSIREQVLGRQHPDTAQSLNNLALLYQSQGKYDQAEPLFRQALSVYEQALGTQHPEIASSLNNLAFLYYNQSKYAQAEPLYKRALSIREQVLGRQHPDTAQSLNNLALLYHKQNKYDQAEPLYKRALSIREQVLGRQHPDTAQSLNNLAGLYYSQDKYNQAEPLFRQALSIYQQMLGLHHPDTVNNINNIVALLDKLNVQHK